MKYEDINKIFEELQEHWIEYCPNCGDNISGHVVKLSELKSVLRRFKK